jgi:type VI protein secretion system component VasK
MPTIFHSPERPSRFSPWAAGMLVSVLIAFVCVACWFHDLFIKITQGDSTKSFLTWVVVIGTLMCLLAFFGTMILWVLGAIAVIGLAILVHALWKEIIECEAEMDGK